MITGELMPVSKRKGDMVIGATLCASSALMMRAKGGDSEVILVQM